MTPSPCRRAISHALLRPVAAAALALALFAGVADRVSAADEKPAAKTTSAFADTSKPVMFLKETMVTGARYPRRYYESPQALSFVNKTQIREAAPTVIGDVLSTLPGSDQSKDSPWEQRPVIRGLAGQRVLVLMDGMPLNSARGNGPHPGLVAPEQIDRVELVRGPSSVAYGSDALGGVINIMTPYPRRPDGTNGLGGYAQIGGSTADQQFNGLVQVTPQVGRLSSFVSFGGRSADDFRSPEGKVPNSSFQDMDFLTNLRYQANDQLAFKLGWQLYRGQDIGIPGLSFDMPGASQSFSFPYYNRDHVQLTMEHSYPESWLANTTVKVYWQQERRDFWSTEHVDSSMFAAFGVFPPPIPGATAVARNTVQDRYLDLSTVGAQVQLTSKKTRTSRFTAGVDALQDRNSGQYERFRTYVYDFGAGPTDVPTAKRVSQPVPDGRFSNLAGFLQGEWFVNPKWTLSAGGRYTYYHYKTDSSTVAPGFGNSPRTMDNSAPSGTIGAVYALNPDVHISGNIATGYRQPNAQDLYFDGAASVGYVIGNPDLKPEQSVSYDLGLRWGPGDLAISGNAFYSTFEDLIDAVAVASPPQAFGQPTYQYKNISKAVMWGGEYEIAWRFKPQWEIRTQGSGVIGDATDSEAIRQLYGVDADHVPLNNVPPFRGSATLRWNTNDGRCWVEPGVRYSWRYDRLPPPVPGVSQIAVAKKEWLVADLAAGYKTARGQKIVVGLRNIADVTYRPALNSLEEPGINAYATIGTEF